MVSRVVVPERVTVATKMLSNLRGGHAIYEPVEPTSQEAAVTQCVLVNPSPVVMDGEEGPGRPPGDDSPREPEGSDFFAADPPSRAHCEGGHPQESQGPHPRAGPEDSPLLYVLRELLPRLDKRPTEHLMRKPRTFDGSNPISWINQMGLYMSRAGAPEQDELSIALSYLDAEALDWYVQALNQQTRPRTWEELKVKLKRHYLAHHG